MKRVIKFVLVGLFLTFFYTLATVLYVKSGESIPYESEKFYNFYFIFIAAFECVLAFFLNLIVSPSVFRELARPIRFEGKTAKLIIAIIIVTVIVIVSYFNAHSINEYSTAIITDMFVFMYLAVVTYFFVFLLEEK